MTLIQWFRSLLDRWFGAGRQTVLRRERLAIHLDAATPRGLPGSGEERAAQLALAPVRGAVSTIEQLDASLPAGVSAAGTLLGDRSAALKLAHAILGGPDPGAGPVATPIAWLRSPPGRDEGDE